MVVVSRYQVEEWLAARKKHLEEITTTLDLGLTKTKVRITPEGVVLDGQIADWKAVELIAKRDHNCFLLQNGKPQKIHLFSQAFNRSYSLHPTANAPTMILGGFPMHRIKDVDPWEDTLRKIGTLGAVKGEILDTTTGLGYTAIVASKAAAHVTTVELDPTVIELCRMNPWSAALFDNPKISQRIGDAYDVIQELPSEHYSAIIHDPPTFKLAGHLYSGEFYAQLSRVLARKGKLFHYTGDFKSAQGDMVARGASRRLKEAGFRHVERKPEAFGLLCWK